jgi:hypothetical protein
LIYCRIIKVSREGSPDGFDKFVLFLSSGSSLDSNQFPDLISRAPRIGEVSNTDVGSMFG